MEVVIFSFVSYVREPRTLIIRTIITSTIAVSIVAEPFIIRVCPYDPYIHHGDNQTLKDCLNHGYYHESSDGSCYLCRLEGKGKCNHYGFEVFIKASENDITESISGSDHVIFYDQYPGERFYYAPGKSIFLDSSHRLKYGLS